MRKLFLTSAAWSPLRHRTGDCPAKPTAAPADGPTTTPSEVVGAADAAAQTNVAAMRRLSPRRATPARKPTTEASTRKASTATRAPRKSDAAAAGADAQAGTSANASGEVKQ